MTERVVAALALTACLLLIVRLALGTARRRRFDAAALALWQRLVGAAQAIRHGRRNRREAERVAREAIERAAGRPPRRDGGNWDGNVYQAKSFRKRRKPH